MVDEYQDVNPSQEELIRGLYRHLDSLFVVGDDDQSIYSWRGADVQNIINYATRYPSSTTHTLSTNYRSTSSIVEASRDFVRVELATGRLDKNPISNSNGNVRHFGNVWFENRTEEASWVADRIEELIGTEYWEDAEGNEKRGLTKADFAVLFRSVKGGTRNGNPPYHTEFTTALENKNIAYSIEAEGSIFTRPYPDVLRKSMELLRHPGAVNRNAAIEFFNLWIVPFFGNASRDEFLRVLNHWNREIHVAPGGARRKVYPQKLVHDLLEAFHVAESNFSDSIMRDLGVFSSIFLDIEKVYVSIDGSRRYQEILNFLQNAADTYDSTSVELLAKPDAVTISTVHKMKGLEYPVVFVVDVIQARFPGNRRRYSGWLPSVIIEPITARGLYETNPEAEARLFYTAITRAERFLYITGSAIQPNLARPKRPSSFKNRLTHPEIVTDPSVLPASLIQHPQIRRIDDNSMPTSFTEIKDYLDCPKKYQFRKLYGFSPAVPELFGFGITTHTAINKIHQLHNQSPPTREESENILRDVFHLKHVFPSNDPNRPGPFENARDKAATIVGNYVSDYSDDFDHSRQMEYQFEIKAGKALITGSIDLLVRVNNEDNILEAKIIDFKTMDFEDDKGERFWIDKSLQVQLYAHAASKVLGENAKTGSIHLLKARNSSSRTNRVEVPIDDEAIVAALKNVEWAVEQILNGDFPMRGSATKCADCDYSQICAKRVEQFSTVTENPPMVKLPSNDSSNSQYMLVGAFSDIN